MTNIHVLQSPLHLHSAQARTRYIDFTVAHCLTAKSGDRVGPTLN